MPHLREQLTAYVDGTLSQAEAAAVAAHLAECAACRDTAADLLAVRKLLASLPAPAPPPALLPRTLARLPRRRRAAGFLPRLVVAAGAAGLLFLALQVRLLPAQMGAQARTWFFRSHAQISAAHPMADVSLASYLSTSLPYAPPEDVP